MANISNEIDEGIKNKLLAPTAEQIDAARTFCQIYYGIGIGVGVVFVILGMLVYQLPVFCPLVGLVLYVASAAIAIYINPDIKTSFLITKVFVASLLIRSISAGLQYRR